MALEDIKSPEDIKKMSNAQLEQLASDIRAFLLEKLMQTGGHLGSNFGVVELTIALHYVFNSPQDEIIWDVGHQAYVHKILTGRSDQFDTLRQYKGLCGFPKRSESEHDVWETGHSSTSLSAAMGMAIAHELKGEKNKVIAVIGDGALTGGMALEALNHIGDENKDLIVVLNDNEMSISPNVGALHNHFGKLRTGRHYKKVKEEVEHLLNRVPAVGGKLAKTIERVKDSLKYLVVSGVLFEELGYTYLGPIDGHNIETLIGTFKQAAGTSGPVLVHVVTEKGRGYEPAKTAVDRGHSVKPQPTYKLESQEPVKKIPSPPGYSKVFAETLIKIAEENPNVVAVTPAMLEGSGLSQFIKRFPDRCFDVGIAEQHAMTLCAGLATQGLKPVCAIYSTFLQRAYDQVIHDVCRQNLNVFIAIDRAGFVGADGETHQGVYDMAFLRAIPNIVLMMPKDENEFQHMIHTAVEYEEGPIAVRYPRGKGLGVPMDQQLSPIPIGKSETVADGRDVAVLALGPMVQMAEKAAEKLSKDGIYPKVVNARFVKPLDEALLDSLAREGYSVITLEEGSAAGGFGSAVLEYYAQNGITDMVVDVMGVPDYFVEHGSVGEQRDEVGLTEEALVQKIKLMKQKQPKRA